MAVVGANESDRHHLINGLPVPFHVTQSQLDYLADFELFSDDTWVVTYPKSGTTWIQQIVRLILTKADGIKRVDYVISWLESTNSVHILDRPRGLKSHMPYGRMPCGLPSGTPCKYIVVVRNPKDVAVSFYHYYSFLFYNGKLRWDEFMSWFLIGDVVYGDYFDHVLSWWKHREDKNVLLLKFEDMIKDLRSSVIQIAQFMGHELSSDLIEKIIEKSSFASMKGDSSANREWRMINIGLDPPKNPFVRKGLVGGWKDYFTPEQSAQYDALYAQKLLSVGLVLDFE